MTRDPGSDPEHQVLLADSIGLALIVVLEALDPAERLAFVLHDMFGVSFEEIAPIVGRSSTAARQLASRARRRVQGATPASDADLRGQREVVDAFLAASRRGDFEALLTVLDPNVVLRGDRGPSAPGASRVVRGVQEVAKGVVFGAQRAAGMQLVNQPVLVNGAAGVVVFADGKPYSVIGFTVRSGRIVEINVLADPARLSNLNQSCSWTTESDSPAGCTSRRGFPLNPTVWAALGHTLLRGALCTLVGRRRFRPGSRYCGFASTRLPQER